VALSNNQSTKLIVNDIILL